ncbi:putative Ig domain-containing protein,Calx-beta domain-containing protein [Xanthomonas vesicatoria ATCC 35937]|uniref:Putative Ig domain-containing protein,Calx-beta domain-containing protein n=1 Tax=Xanthomonas vesicatoria ATCC 35937 TaxID=925775 RepID=F0BCF7_9XANT|nr:putative Ig domain-containing protein,Calx-beta domain-containing protein [Xanthomonas vesicatoria ATCC 35937]
MRWMVAVMICALALLLPGQVWAQGASAYCSTQNATINRSGSVTFDVSNCDGPSNIGMGDDPRNPLDANGRGSTANGSIQLSFQSGPGTQTVTYTHGGNSATSDTFYLRDEDENVLTFNITINPSRTASIAVSPVNSSEDSGAAFVYTVTLSQTNTSATTVNLARSGTATSVIDYSGAVSSVVVPPNASSASFSVTPIADGVVEPDETVTFSVANGTGYSPGSPASATATIVNDDVTTASIAVSPASVAEDGGTNLTYTVTLTNPSSTAVSIGFSIGGTATSGTDFAAVNSPLVIPAGQTSGSIVIDPTADATSEPDETVVITLSAGSGYVVGSPNSATGTIVNDDVPSLSINDVSVNEGNAGTTTATFTVSLSQPAGAGGVSFDIGTADGTANAGSDYVASSLSGRTIPAGSSSATFSVLVNGDTLNEPDETYFVNVSNVTGANVADAQGLGTIVNDDTAPALSIDDVSVIEGNSGTTTATFTVSLSTASGQTVTVNYATADGTATAGSDYAARSGTLSFAPGTTTQTVAISVNGDLSVEPNETYRVVLSSATNATIARATGTGTINNDDAVVIIAPASLPAATAGTAYTQNLSASGGTAPYTFALSAGALPAGVTLSASGVLTGTPTASGSFNFTVSATDSGAPTTGSRAYTLVVAGAAVNLPATTLAPGTAGQAYSAAITPASGGIAPYTYALAAGVLPAGITVNSATGALSGTPTAPGTYNQFHPDGHGQHLGNAVARKPQLCVDHRCPADRGRTYHGAGCHAWHCVQPGVERQWRHRAVHLCDCRRRVAGGPDPGQQRHAVGYGDSGRHVQLHRAGDRCQQLYRHAGVCADRSWPDPGAACIHLACGHGRAGVHRGHHSGHRRYCALQLCADWRRAAGWRGAGHGHRWTERHTYRGGHVQLHPHCLRQHAQPGRAGLAQLCTDHRRGHAGDRAGHVAAGRQWHRL